MLIVERNEAAQQRQQLKAVHDSTYALMKRMLKFNEKLTRRAVKRNQSEIPLLQEEEPACSNLNSAINNIEGQNDEIKKETSEIINAIQNTSLHQLQDKSREEQDERYQRAIKAIERETEEKKTQIKQLTHKIEKIKEIQVNKIVAMRGTESEIEKLRQIKI